MKDSNNLEASPFSLWLEAYRKALKVEFTLFNDDDYALFKSAIRRNTIKELPVNHQIFIKRNNLRVSPVNLLDKRSTYLHQRDNLSNNSSYHELLALQYASNTNQSPASVTFKIIVPYSKISKIVEKLHKSTSNEETHNEVHIGYKKTYA
jgi:hypothetical protein